MCEIKNTNKINNNNTNTYANITITKQASKQAKSGKQAFVSEKQVFFEEKM